MQISTFVRRRDFFVLRLSALVLPGFNFWLNVVCAGILAWYAYLYDQPTTLVPLAVMFYFAIAWLFLLIANMVGALFELVFISSLRRGFLGQHRFTLEPDGLLEETSYNRTLHMWSSVGITRRFLGALLLRAGTGWHVFPSSTFSDSLSRGKVLEAIAAHKAKRPNAS